MTAFPEFMNNMKATLLRVYGTRFPDLRANSSPVPTIGLFTELHLPTGLPTFLKVELKINISGQPRDIFKQTLACITPHLHIYECVCVYVFSHPESVMLCIYVILYITQK